MDTTTTQVTEIVETVVTADPNPLTWLAQNQAVYKKFPPKQKAFLNAYISNPSIKRTCEKIGVSTVTFYNWMHKSKEFSMAFECVKKMGLQTLEDEVVRRALEGVEEAVFNKDGKVIGTKTKYSDSLLMFYLNGNAPEKYKNRNAHEHSGPGGGPILSVDLLDTLVKD